MPTNPSYLDTHAWVLFQLGLPDEARRYIERALHYGASATIHEHHGDILEALGLLDDAVRAWQEALRMDPDRNSAASRISRYR
jgi:tetratricopeptide (TPR) repeat protein